MKKTLSLTMLLLVLLTLGLFVSCNADTIEKLFQEEDNPPVATISVTGVTLDKPELSLQVGGSGNLTATITPENATNKKVSWSSDKESVATVSNGTVTAKAVGTAYITVTTEDGSRTATCTVKVTSSSDLKYTVYFDTKGGSTVPSQTVSQGGTATTPTDPTKGGYYLDGWYSDSGLTTPCNFNTPVNADITLYAKWVPNGFVDLGVKNSEDKPLYWAKWNLGASTPTDYGYYYAWAGTTGYIYDTNESKWKNENGDDMPDGGFNSKNAPYSTPTDQPNKYTYTKYTTTTTLDSSDDAATNKDPKWRMPTSAEFVELAANCVWIWTPDYNETGKSGYIVYKAKNNGDKGKANMNGTWKKWNGSSYAIDSATSETYSISDPHHIFLPAAGLGNGNNLMTPGLGGCYQSRVLSDEIEHNYILLIGSGTIEPKKSYQVWRHYGYSIRPVRED